MGNAFRDLLLSKSGLKSYWPLDGQVDGSGNALDLKSGYNAVKQGGITLGGAPGLLPSNPSQPATNFDPTGTPDYLSVAHQPALAITGDITLLFLINTSTFNAPHVLGKVDSGVHGYFIEIQSGTGKPRFRNSAGDVVATNPIASGARSFVVATRSGTTIQHFLDGVPNGSGTLATDTDGGGPLGIGRCPPFGQYLTGAMGHAAILAGALSPAEVAELQLAATYLESSLLVRELPPDRQDIDILTPSGRHYHWAEDEPNPANVFSDLRNSSVMPGGFESMDCRLPRKSGTDYADLERLSTATIRDASGGIDGEYRLERAPRVSGDEFVISPSAVGWQAHLEDNRAAAMVYVDQDLGHWQAPSVQRKVNLQATYGVSDAAAEPDATTGQPSLATRISGNWTAAPGIGLAEGWYDAGAFCRIGSLYYAWKRNPNINNADTGWTWAAALLSDDVATASDASGNLRAAGPSTGTLTATDALKRFALVQLFYGSGPAGAANVDYAIFWTRLAAYGNHSLTKRGTADATHAQGFFDGDVVPDILSRFCPLLRYTTGPDGTITPSGFVIDHLEFRDPTTPAEMLKQTLRFVVRDWAVWENRTFWLHDRGARGRKWRARVGPSQLNENGPQMDRLWESIVVQYNDVDGSTRTVGPPGSNADSTDSRLKDSDTENPANKLGITRRDLLVMGTSTPAGAAEVGARFMVEQKKLDTSGQAQFVGYVQDDRGVIHPASRVRAGDQVSFIDAADTSYRRIVKADHNRSSRTCSIDLDSPPDGLQALLEELAVVLVPLGFT